MDAPKQDDYKWDIFLAHDGRDKKEAECLAGLLEKHSLRVFLDKVVLQGGDDWTLELPKHQRMSRATVVLLARPMTESELSTYFQAEIHIALELARRNSAHAVIPVLIRNIDPIEMPYGLSTREYVTAFGEQDLEQAAEQISVRYRCLPDPSRLAQQSRTVRGLVVSGRIRDFMSFGQIERQPVAEVLRDCVEAFDRDVFPIDWLEFRGGEFLLFVQCDEPDDVKADLSEKALFWAFSVQSKVSSITNNSEHIFPLESEKKTEITIALDWESGGRQLNVRTTGATLTSYRFGAAFINAPILTDFTNRPHVLISDALYQVFYKYYGKNIEARILNSLRAKKNKLPFLSDYFIGENSSVFLQSIALYDQNKDRYSAYNVYLEIDNKLVGNDSAPLQKVWIEYRDNPHTRDSKHNAFVRKLVDADDVLIIGITNETLVKFLRTALKERDDKFWDRLCVVFAGRKVLNTIDDQYSPNNQTQANSIRYRNWELGLSSVFRFLRSHSDQPSQWKCIEFPGNLPFIGQRFSKKKFGYAVDSIRVAPILPGSDYKNSYYMEVFEGQKVYDQLSSALQFMEKLSNQLTEWNVYGTCSNLKSNWTFGGIVNRELTKTLESASQEQVYLAVLIMLYTKHVDNRYYAVLQKRDPYNATSDYGKYSNISGLVTEIDVAHGLELPTERWCQGSDGKDMLSSIATDRFRSMVGPHRFFEQAIPCDSDEILKISTAAAVRELREELGIDGFKPPTCLKVPMLLNRGNRKLLFQLFSLELNEEYLQAIKIRRPDCALEKMDLEKLKILWKEGELNVLLTENFKDAFLSCYQNLGIS